MEKKTYSKPVLGVEEFLANEYCSGCFTYTAKLVCKLGLSKVNNERPPYGWEGYHVARQGEAVNFTDDNGINYKGEGAEHGAACAESTVTVTVRNGVTTYAGTEGADKKHIVLESVIIPGIDQVQQVGEEVYGCSWQSAGNYKHTGDGVVTYFSTAANAS